jgi:pentatricopeptide repeat protein
MKMGIANAFGWVGDALGRLFGTKAGARSRKMSSGSMPGPILLDFDDCKKQPRLFQKFHFSGRTTHCIMDESLWRDFEEFYRAPQTLSWWLITGKAGSGKSRVALEFCRALETGEAEFRFPAGGSAEPVEVKPVTGEDFSSWTAGFLDLMGTPFSTWKDWKPDQHTLLVFDQATRHYNDSSRFCPGWQDGEDLRHRFNVAEIIKLLAAKAEQGDFGPYRVRLLLLEREHRQIGWDWGRDVSEDSSLRFKEDPTLLPSVTSEGLFGIAQDVWKDIGWDSSDVPGAAFDAFLDKLCSVDSDRRALFALLLATAMTTDGGAQAAFTRRDVLKLALKDGYERILQLTEKEGAAQAMRVLALSTMTGGRLGACDLDKDHALWNSGLGHAARGSGEEGIFYPWPLEPELLGESFVLDDMGQDDIPEDARIGDDEMRALIAKAWETCSPEMAYFFESCGQDFSFDPTWIETRFLNCRLADVDTPLYMRTAVNLVTWFGKCQLDATRKIYEHMNSVGNAGMFCRERAEVSTNLIRVYCEAGMFDEASPIFLAMNALGDSEEVRRCRAAASVYLVGELCKVGELVRARVMFEGALAFEETEEYQIPKVLALISLINGYARAGDFNEARELFESLAIYGDSEVIRVQRAKASVNLIVCYSKAGRFKDARAIFEAMSSLGNEPKVRTEYTKASKFLGFFAATEQGEEEEGEKEQSVAASA